MTGVVSIAFVIMAKMGSGPQVYPGDKTDEITQEDANSVAFNECDNGHQNAVIQPITGYTR